MVETGQMILITKLPTIEQQLHHCPIDRLDAELLIAHVLERPRSWILAHAEIQLTPLQERRFTEFVRRRRNLEPLAYITGEKEFYGRAFVVTEAVLIPRPSTEHLVTQALQHLRDWKPHRGSAVTPADRGIVILSFIFEHKICSITSPRHLLDVGTGSGCVGITLALEDPTLRILGTDISEEALEVARRNADHWSVGDRCTFAIADGFPADHLLQQYFTPSVSFGSSGSSASSLFPFLLVSNPPYLRESSKGDPMLAFEPRHALFAGAEGLSVLLPLARAARRHPSCLGVLLECREDQVTAVVEALG